MMIVREGFPFIFIGLVITVALVLLSAYFDSRWFVGLATIFAILTVFTAFFFRNPERSFIDEPGALVSPADGKVVAIVDIKEHPFIGGPAKRISIFLSVFDVHINRMPTDGVVDYVKYNPGKFLAAFEDKASDLNEQTEIGVRADSGHKLVVKQIAGLIARRIVCKVNTGQTVAAGERFGLIRFGSRTDLIVPADTEIRVKIGDRVRGGESIMGLLELNETEQRDTNGIRAQKNI